mmetsp:Transcript_21943/g.61534  ORF Transcript_21943/g.61534 Transcript_21943/m.61534 type:complete len:186 (-) Transcript_21943:84-641(-)
MPLIPVEADFDCESSLRSVLKPEYHKMIGKWMQNASDTEKRGIIKLARMGKSTSEQGMSEPGLHTFIGRPKAASGPAISENPWYSRKGPAQMSRSGSDPGLRQAPQQTQHEYVVPSWMHEDAHDIAQIRKPGGYVVALKDTVTIQRMKNAQRNSGTYQLFSGSFDGTTTAAAQNNAASLAMMGTV